MQGTLPRRCKKIGGRNPVLESSSHLGGACPSLVQTTFEDEPLEVVLGGPLGGIPM